MKLKAELKYRGTNSGIVSLQPYRDDMQETELASLFGHMVVYCIAANRKQGYDFREDGFEVVCSISKD